MVEEIAVREDAGRLAALGAFEAPFTADAYARLEVIEHIEGPERWLTDSDRCLRLVRTVGELAREILPDPLGDPLGGPDRVVVRSLLLDLVARATSWGDWIDERAACEARQAKLALGGMP
jgi:hypothetical protein